jgi:hypothetical protein
LTCHQPITLRIRLALDSTPARAWLDAHRNGNRIYFGRYTSRTPIPGDSNEVRLREELRDMAREGLSGGNGVRGFLYHVPNPAPVADQAYPAICPRCDEDRRRRRLDTPMGQRNLRGAPNPTFDQGEQLRERALGSIMRTDLLVVGIHSIPQELDLSPHSLVSPLRVDGRAALYSFGFLLSRAAAVMLDISPWEIRVGLRVVPGAHGQIVGQVFLSDSLENGAGYCSHFARQDKLEELLRFVADETKPLLREILAPHHANPDACQTSCPDCLRDYANLAWHCILDWRLAVDVARLALDANAPVSLTTPHWQPLAAAKTTSYFQSLGWAATAFAGLPAARSNTQRAGVWDGVIIKHPLWGENHPTIIQARNEANAAGIPQPQFKSLFELMRRPF